MHHRNDVPGKLGRRKADWVGTLEVWPWSILVPWFRQDMRQRVSQQAVQCGAGRRPARHLSAGAAAAGLRLSTLQPSRVTTAPAALPALQMEALKAAAKDDPAAWQDYKSPANRTYWWNEARNSSGAPPLLLGCWLPGCWAAGLLGRCAAALHGWVGHPPHACTLTQLLLSPIPRVPQCGCCPPPSRCWTRTTIRW